MVKILIGGDIAPVASNEKDFINGDRGLLLGTELSELLLSADYTLFNLENPLYVNQTPFMTFRECMGAPAATINGIGKIAPHFLGLANNHIMDQGAEGLKTTLRLLDEKGISHAGAGMSISEAGKPFITELKGVKIGIYCCAEHEFSIAEAGKPGANPYDPLETFDQVTELKKNCDFMIILYHGGKEQYRYPSPDLQRIFHKFADEGADLVIAQHTHCIGCQEKYRNSRLIYGQGNFHFTECHNEFWDSGILIETDIDEKRGGYEIVYHVINAEGDNPRLADKEMQKSMLDAFEKRSEAISLDGFIKKNYEEYAKANDYSYAVITHGKRTLLDKLYDKFYIKRKHPDQGFEHYYDKAQLRALVNVIECEAHREIIIKRIKDLLKL